MTITAMTAEQKLDCLTGETLLYPILGDPIAFVKSPRQLTHELQSRGHNGACVPMRVPQGQLEPLIHGLDAIPNIRGLLITMPHKNAMFSLCATHSEVSGLLGAVNIVRRSPDGCWHGDMLDGLAFVAAQAKAGAELHNAKVLQIGAGGAGSAIALALLDAGVSHITLHDSDSTRLHRMVQLLGELRPNRVVAGPPDPEGCDMIVNASPMGMSSNDPLPVATDRMTASMFVGDVVAGHGITPLLQAAQELGCRTADGFQMVQAGTGIMADFLLAPQTS